MSKRLYVCGFCFDAAKDYVALIEKTKPEWQAGKLNGVGGKIEPFELPIEAMVREFKEETSIETSVEDWTHFAILENEDWVVHFYKATTDQIFNVQSVTEERVDFYDVDYLLKNDENLTVPNLKWLIPMALQNDVLSATVLYARDGS